LFGGDAPQPNTFVGKKDGGARQQKLSKLQNRVLSPSLKEKNASTQ
jgi:hypothetical protein